MRKQRAAAFPVTDWSPAQYLRFGTERLRPGIDLLARVPLERPRTVYDLGCGTGALTATLKARWPESRVIGVDASEAMLAKASARQENIEWQRADLTSWQPEARGDLVYSNAALHWLDDHAHLFPTLLRTLEPGGVLAVQMPNNFQAPTHAAIAEIARDARWNARLRTVVRERPVLDARAYHEILDAAGATPIDVWETVYYHRLEGEDPVVEWTRGSVLRPVLDALEPPEREIFLERYREALRAAYPKREDGRTLLPFKRLFIVASRHVSTRR